MTLPPGETTTAATPGETTTAATPDPCEDCAWHESYTQYATCSNSGEYPPAWEAARPHFFFRTSDECCSKRFPDGCTVEDVSSGSDMHPELGLHGYESFEGELRTMPFDFGDSPMWRIDNSTSNIGNRSVTNVANNVTGAASDLVLKLSVSSPSTVSCVAKIDTKMPYDHFMILVDGQQRNTYYQQADWQNVLTGLDVGNHTVIFRVQNGQVSASNLPPVRVPERFGTGHVWLDDCQVNSSY